MPIGSFAVLPDAVFELVNKQPKSVLDLGIGFGMYGAAVREWVDMGVYPFKTIVHGVECFSQYRSPLWDLYNEVYINTIEQFTPPQKYDAITIMDVIEHFSLEDGIYLLNIIKTWLNPGGIILVATPAIFCAQGAVYGNEKETHLSVWTNQNFIDNGFTPIRSGQPDKYGHMMLLAKYIKA